MEGRRRRESLVIPGDWQSEHFLGGEAGLRLLLLDQDVQCAQLALADYDKARAKERAPHTRWDARERRRAAVNHARLFYSAKNFVCAVRRVTRLAESLVRTRGVYPAPLLQAFAQIWRKKKAALESFAPARNAVEHIDERVGKDKLSALNMQRDQFVVAEGQSAPITSQSLAVVLSLRAELVAALRTHLPRSPTRRQLLRQHLQRLKKGESAT